MYIDIREKEERKNFLDKVLTYDEISLRSKISISIELAKEDFINSKYPIMLNLDLLEISHIETHLGASCALSNKEAFVSPEEALQQIDTEIKKWRKYKEEVIKEIMAINHESKESAEKSFNEDIDIVRKYSYLKNETPHSAALEFYNICG